MGRILDNEKAAEDFAGICGKHGSVLRAGGTALETGSQREASCREGSSIAA